MIEIMPPTGTPGGPSKVFVTDDDPPQIQVMLPFEVAAALRELFFCEDEGSGEEAFEAMRPHMLEASRLVDMLPSWRDIQEPPDEEATDES